jgi:hypothetical protein
MAAPALRLQVVVTGPDGVSRLYAEVIGEFDAVLRLSAHYARRKAAAGQPVGGMMTARADIRRFWDVPVGAPVGLPALDPM